MAPKCKNSDAGNSDMPKRNHEQFPLSEKACMCRKKRSIYRGLVLSVVSGIH